MLEFKNGPHRRLLGALALALVAACDRQPSLEEHLARAEAAAAKNDLTSAVIELKAAVQENPEATKARVMLGEFYFKEGDGASAVKEFETAIRLGVPRAEVILPLTRAYLIKRDFKAIKELGVLGDDGSPSEEFKSLQPAELATLVALTGNAHLLSEEVDAAAQRYNIALGVAANNPDALVGKAKIAVLKGDESAAIQLLQQVTKNNPDFASAWALLGDLALYDDKLEDAVTYFASALQYNPANTNARVSRAIALLQLGRVDESKKELAELRKIHGNMPLVTYVAGVLAKHEGKLKEAKAALQETVNAMPKYMPAVYALGATHFKLREYEQADALFSRVVEARPEFTSAAMDLALTKLANHDADGALQLLRGVLEYDPQNQTVLQLIGQISLKQGRGDEGVKHLQALVDANRDSPDAYRTLGNGLTLAGRFDEAQAAYRRALEAGGDVKTIGYDFIYGDLLKGDVQAALRRAKDMAAKDPNDSRAAITLAYLHLGLSQFAEADAVLKRVIEREPANVAALYFTGKSLLAQSQPERAYEHFAAANQQVPQSAWLLSGLATAELQLDKQKEAAQHFTDAVSLEPKMIDPRVGLIKLAVGRDDYAEIARIAQEGLQFSPENLQLLRAYATAQGRLGESKKAVEALEKLAKLLPDNPAAQYDLALGYLALGDKKSMAAQLDRVEKLDPDHLGIGVLRTRNLVLGGKLEAAASKLAALRQKHGDLPILRKQEALLALRKQDYAGAADIYESLLKADADDADAVMHLAQTYLADQKADKAVALLEPWIKAHPDVLPLKEQLASMYVRLGQQDRAAAVYEGILESAPKNLGALNNLAMLIVDVSPERATTLIETAMKESTDAPEIMDSAASIYASTGRTAEATDLRRRLIKKSDSPRYRLALAQLLQQQGGNDEEIRDVVATLKESDLTSEEDRAWLRQVLK